ncbi:RagB/SusD family nutrient uptake outer membrane protein [Bacteroides sp. A1-P5]|uniref:RagB/SusD family nutrient uptake outer membrane protein n=1 Tax=Bacteroides vicugnae TaxID=3037989 RepID=A0ABU5HLX2_9BACE|nr:MULTISPECIES: RagB/SusD family nutrient uptake outer membrane protein [unclassified Bacteroides]MDY7254438.1 RagB/SusD family nutrient uptake outer membrane protein [Bacteroides sp. A1-P5]MDY7257191.1 RagB/SusD family nutrient uptake outer membrane protein [Bacteroides sp. A2-P53]
MKKFTLYSFAALALMLGTASCGDDFLSVEPSSSLPIDGYYTTESRMMESAVAAYDPMQWYDYFGGWAPLSLVWDAMADDMYVGGGNTSDQSQIHLISQYKSDPRNNIDGAWTTSYSGINRSIRLIDNAKASDLSDDKKALFIAEGRAMRAWYYLVLWKTWGNIPFYEENLTSLPYLADQLTVDQVYEKVVVDLESVLDSEVLPMKQPDEWAGRMTQAAASMIYADYVMYQKDQSRYGKALGYMKAIINSHKYDLVKNYNDLYALDKEWNEEIIFDVNYIAKGGKRTWGDANFTGGTVYPEMIGIDGLTIKCAEGHTPEFTSGWGFGSVSKEVYDAFEDNDRRRNVAILNLDKYARAKFAEGDTVTYGGRYQNTGYFLRKYLPRPGDTEGSVGDAGLNHDENLHLYRYAETLLNAAELALATGDGLAQDYFDLVRERAGVASIPVTVDNIINERRLEFVGEGKRYFDLVRSGKAATVLKAGAGVVLRTKRTYNFDKNQWEGENTWGGQAIPERVDWTENKKYIPIPQSEIEAAQGSITQNPY